MSNIFCSCWVNNTCFWARKHANSAKTTHALIPSLSRTQVPHIKPSNKPRARVWRNIKYNWREYNENTYSFLKSKKYCLSFRQKFIGSICYPLEPSKCFLGICRKFVFPFKVSSFDILFRNILCDRAAFFEQWGCRSWVMKLPNYSLKCQSLITTLDI